MPFFCWEIPPSSWAIPMLCNKQVVPHALKGGMEIGAIKKFDTLEDLAKDYNMPVDVFKEQVARWNSFVEKKKDDDLGCMIFQDAKPTVDGAFLCRETLAQGSSYHGRIGDR